MRTPVVAAALLVLGGLSACATNLLDSGDDAGADMATAAADFATPVDLAVAPVVDAAPCVPPSDAATPGCPCGGEGLCRPASGRIVVQTKSAGGTLRLEVMDDNGCNRRPVAFDFPLGTPKWAADRERFAYISAKGNSVAVNVVRVDGRGNAVCHAAAYVPGHYNFTDVAWAGDHALWLFSAQTQTLGRYELGNGVVSTTTLAAGPHADHFDALGGGPLVVAANACVSTSCKSEVELRPAADSGPFTSIFASMVRLGALRLDAAAKRVVVERENEFDVIDVASGMTLASVMLDETPHLPAFALDGHAVVYTTDSGALRFHPIDSGAVEDIPPTWKTVFSPDWAPMPAACSTSGGCQ